MSDLALLGGTPVTSASDWPEWPVFDESDERRLLATLRSRGWGGFPLPNVRAAGFAEAFAARHDSPHALCVSNGTVALEVGLQALGVEPGAEVIVPAYTFEATASAALFSGCVPVFADVDPQTYCIDPAHVESLVGSRTQAIIPVHLAMGMADLDALGDIASRHGLAVLEDCAHAHGARWRGKGAGSHGDAAGFSFQTSKLMSSGEGGAVLCRDEATLDRVYALVNCGRQRPERAADQPLVGHNYRLSDLQAAVLQGQLDRLDEQHARRAASAAELARLLEDASGIEPLRVDERVTTQAIYQYVLRYDPDTFGGLERDVFVAALNAEGLPCDGQFYEAVYRSELFQMEAKRYPAWAASEQRPHCPNAMRAAYEESIWIPHQVLLSEPGSMTRVAEAVFKVAENAAQLIEAQTPEIDRLRRPRSRR